MKAVVCKRYGGPEVLNVQNIPVPQPQDDEILVKIEATAITAASSMMRTGKPYFGRLFLGLTGPKMVIPGTDLAGEIITVGKHVNRFKIGDKIVASTDVDGGAYAEYACLKEQQVMTSIPKTMTAADATGMIDGAMTALSFFKDVITLQKGQKILINGASGSIGTAAVQLANYFGAEVTGVCSGKNATLVTSLGAQQVIDYKKEDFIKYDSQYDVIFDTVGKLDFKTCKKVLSPNGVFLTPVLSASMFWHLLWSNRFSSQQLKFSATGLIDKKIKQKNLELLKDIIEAGHFKTVIDRRYSLDQIQDAHRYVDLGHKVGNVIVAMG